MKLKNVPPFTVLLPVLVFALAACNMVPRIGVYQMEIQQGNFVSQEMMSQVKAGMTKDQVRFILGTPLVSDIFHADRWDYVFARKRVNSNELEQRHIVIFFEEGRLKRIDGDVVAAGVAPAAPAGVPSSATSATPAVPAQPDNRP
jgi:outer membrane protein assembly factor BamE